MEKFRMTESNSLYKMLTTEDKNVAMGLRWIQ